MPRKSQEANNPFPMEMIASVSEVDEANAANKLFTRTALNVRQSTLDADFLKLNEWQQAPELYMNEVLNFYPWTCPDADDQLDIVHAVRDFPRVTVRSGNGVGKTAIAARIALWFLTCHYPSIVITTAPTTRQVEKLLWGEIRRAYKTANIEIGGDVLTTEIRLDDNWYALGFSTDEPERFQGFHSAHILIIVDEASGMAEPIFEAIEGILTSENARILLIGNPTDPSGYFGRTFLHPRESQGWKHLNLNCWNSPNVRNGINDIPALCGFKWPKEKLVHWGEFNPFYQVRVLGNFPEIGADNLIPYHLVHAALERSRRGVGDKLIGVDVARFGDDASVISRLQGAQFRVLKKQYKQDGNMLADSVMECIKRRENRDVKTIKIDIIGWGASCYDALNKMKKKGNDIEKKLLKKVNLVEVNVSEKPKSVAAAKDYKNIRAETAFMIREMFEDGDIDIDNEDLAVQAANIKFDFTEGRYLLEKKKKFKERLRVSPDEFDSLIISKAIARGAIPRLW
jgi:hypothetical protein